MTVKTFSIEYETIQQKGVLKGITLFNKVTYPLVQKKAEVKRIRDDIKNKTVFRTVIGKKPFTVTKILAIYNN